ncbi:hypothetical protein AMATHDRAFT_178364 [Amanita thiersii Skay4041]|uniref:Carboxylic ester hydrolase n=1 Tax=Amanita thiersii Skay4041 TaxID=703135 RepID=A0A2A9NN18_9AGAR|nr:hypothetical protein AMATHDRAFT_178364 [Amanita thiersii Skay4041]
MKSLLSSPLIITLFGITSLAPFVAGQTGDGLQVHTRQGDVVGTLVLPTVRQFLGIPYAVAERWEPPRLPPDRNTTFNASSFGDSCPQDLNASALKFLELAGLPTVEVTESEECQSVNIWAPSVGRPQKTAVMIWIYGGGFTFGTSNIPIYDGQNIVRDHDDVMVVSFNYRLNIFGQPGAPQLAGRNNSQNFGVLDIDAAVQWVHDNIAAFGGDPERIILFGESAGAVATDIYAFSHPNDNIVKGVHLTVTSNLTLLNPALWNTIAGIVGCGNDTSAEQLACMKAVPTKKLETAVIDSNIAFGPLADNITIFADTVTRGATGNFLRVPLLGGTNAQEGDIFVLISELLETGIAIPGITQTASEFTTLVGFCPTKKCRELSVLQAGFSCPASFTAKNRADATVPTWRYQYQAVFPDISTRPDLRAYHSSEIPIVFGTYNLSIVTAPTPAEIALSKYVQTVWVTFARNPSGGLNELGWPFYHPDADSLALLGGPLNETGAAFTKPAFIDFPCAFEGALAAATGVFNAALLGGP